MTHQSILIFSLLAGLVSSCVLETTPPVALHDFGVPLATISQAAPIKLAITVEAPQWFWETSIHYRLLYASPTTVRAYQLDRWIAPPPELFQQHLLAADLALAAPLTIRLLDFEQQFANPNAAHVVLRFVAEFGNTTGQAVTSREFRIQQATKTADAAGAVNAFAEAAKQATNSLGKWLAQVGHDDRLKPR